MAEFKSGVPPRIQHLLEKDKKKIFTHATVYKWHWYVLLSELSATPSGKIGRDE